MKYKNIEWFCIFTEMKRICIAVSHHSSVPLLMYFSPSQWGCNEIPSALTRPQCVMEPEPVSVIYLPRTKQTSVLRWALSARLSWPDLKLQCRRCDEREPGQLDVMKTNLKGFILGNIGTESDCSPLAFVYGVCVLVWLLMRIICCIENGEYFNDWNWFYCIRHVLFISIIVFVV